ncbi:hypothetical protein [Bacillus proteolyticus]|uniref:hypothetical protein n=1 Tax=Bacillus proteolyticus TaxID=2026192 RepID=UPI003D051E5F
MKFQESLRTILYCIIPNISPYEAIITPAAVVAILARITIGVANQAVPTVITAVKKFKVPINEIPSNILTIDPDADIPSPTNLSHR